MGCAHGATAAAHPEPWTPKTPARGTLLATFKANQGSKIGEGDLGKPVLESRRMLAHLDSAKREELGALPRVHQAAKDGDLQAVQFLLKNTLEDEARRRSAAGATPLHVAAAHGRMSVARALVAAGADVNRKDDMGSTPLHEAAAHGYVEMVRALLASGASVDATDVQSMTPLHWAARMGHEAVACALLDAGADLQARTNQGKNAYDIARRWGTKSMADFFKAQRSASAAGNQK